MFVESFSGAAEVTRQSPGLDVLPFGLTERLGSPMISVLPPDEAIASVEPDELAEIDTIVLTMPDHGEGQIELVFLGSDTVFQGGDGASTLIGDVATLGGEATAFPPPVTGGVSIFVLGSDILVGDQDMSNGGDDLLIGDVHLLESVLAEFATGSHPPQMKVVLTFGNDILAGGAGDDEIVGDLYEGYIAGFGYYSDATEGLDGLTTVNWGHDRLFGGAGDDNLTGDTVGGAFSYGYLKETFGNDHLDGGSGSDRLFGDVGDAHHSWAGWSYLNTTSDNIDYDIIASLWFFEDRSFALHYGHDNLEGGDGNDDLFGDIAVIEYQFLYGDTFGSLSFGDDTLSGGNGDDHIFGDAIALHFLAYPLISDFGDPGPMMETVAVSIEFGDDIIVGGAGDDILYGDLPLWGVQVPQDERTMTLSITRGADHFIFAPDSGHDTIMDFVAGIDTLDLSAYGFADVADIVWSWQGDDILIDLDGTSEDVASILIVGGDISYSDILI